MSDNKRMMRKAPLKCRIPGKLFGISSSAILSGCAYGRKPTSKKCDRCPFYADVIYKKILSNDEALKFIEAELKEMEADNVKG